MPSSISTAHSTGYAVCLRSGSIAACRLGYAPREDDVALLTDRVRVAPFRAVPWICELGTGDIGVNDYCRLLI